jgi:UDP-3-O-[3-hydroxymyristoyl] glucosamine N-acyltransferase
VTAEAGSRPDDRFFEALDPIRLEDLARLCGGVLENSDSSELMIHGVAPLARAGPRTVAFLGDRRYVPDLAVTRAAACFVARGDAGRVPATSVALTTPIPQGAWALAAGRLHRARAHPADAPAIHPEALLEEGVALAPCVTIGPGAMIGRGTAISAGAVVGPGVCIGRNGYVGPGAVIGFALIGDGVKIYGGAVIGEAGFGATLGPRGIMDVPQLGRVIIQDNVTVGANSCVDRGAFGDTVVGENTKIDNLVQVAHNAVIGRNCLLAAFTGISGSAVVGDGCMFGGRAGVADHVTIGAGAKIAAAAGVMKDVPPGESWGGSPARPVKRWMRETALVAALARRRMETGRGG